MFAGNQFTLLMKKFTDCCLRHALKLLVVEKEKGSHQLCLIWFWMNIILHRTSKSLSFSIVDGECSRCGQVPEHHAMHLKTCTRVSANFDFLGSSLLCDLETGLFECPLGDYKNKNCDKVHVCQISFNYSGM
jgi:hypothetical protein